MRSLAIFNKFLYLTLASRIFVNWKATLLLAGAAPFTLSSLSAIAMIRLTAERQSTNRKTWWPRRKETFDVSEKCSPWLPVGLPHNGSSDGSGLGALAHSRHVFFQTQELEAWH
jgi:hypothetical protein